jgi:hypothetical protein
MKSKEVQNNIFVFYNLLIVILKRRELFRIFESKLIDKATQEEVETNSFISYYTTDYNRGQLIDLRKFFETDSSSYKISELVSHVDNQKLKEAHRALFKAWKDKFQDQVNMLIAHVDKDSGELVKHVNKHDLDAFIDQVDQFVFDLIEGIRTKGTLVIQDDLRDPESYFLKIEPQEDLETYLNWSRN